MGRLRDLDAQAHPDPVDQPRDDTLTRLELHGRAQRATLLRHFELRLTLDDQTSRLQFVDDAGDGDVAGDLLLPEWVSELRREGELLLQAARVEWRAVGEA